jgi:hypothetical protein
VPRPEQCDAYLAGEGLQAQPALTELDACAVPPKQQQQSRYDIASPHGSPPKFKLRAVRPQARPTDSTDSFTSAGTAAGERFAGRHTKESSLGPRGSESRIDLLTIMDPDTAYKGDRVVVSVDAGLCGAEPAGAAPVGPRSPAHEHKCVFSSRPRDDTADGEADANIQNAIKACRPETRGLMRNREQMQTVRESLDEGYCNVTGKAGDLVHVGAVGDIKVYAAPGSSSFITARSFADARKCRRAEPGEARRGEAGRP